jgi:hypothetical protein
VLIFIYLFMYFLGRWLDGLGKRRIVKDSEGEEREGPKIGQGSPPARLCFS